MRFDAPIVYNGWTAALTRQSGGRPSAGSLFEAFDPANVQAVGYLDKRALQDGIDAGDVYLGARQFTGIVSVFGSTWGDFWDKTDSFLAAFSPTLAYDADSANLGFLPFDFFQPTANIATWPTSAFPNGIPMRYYVRPVAPPGYALRRDDVGGDDGQGLSRRFTLSMVARDPRKYRQTTVEVTASSATLTYRGNYSSFPTISWTQTTTGSASFRIVIDGHSTTVNLSAQTSGAFVLDYSRRMLTRDGVNRPDLVTATAWPQVRSGTTYRRENDTGTSGVTLSYREAWA